MNVFKIFVLTNGAAIELAFKGTTEEAAIAHGRLFAKQFHESCTIEVMCNRQVVLRQQCKPVQIEV